MWYYNWWFGTFEFIYSLWECRSHWSMPYYTNWVLSRTLSWKSSMHILFISIALLLLMLIEMYLFKWIKWNWYCCCSHSDRVNCFGKSSRVGIAAKSMLLCTNQWNIIVTSENCKPNTSGCNGEPSWCRHYWKNCFENRVTWDSSKIL